MGLELVGLVGIKRLRTLLIWQPVTKDE